MNRVADKIAAMEANIQRRLADGTTTPEKVEATRQSLDMDFEEYCRFQELKSLGVIEQVLTLEEGMTIFAYLGGTLEHFNKQSAAVKAVLTKILGELLEARITQLQATRPS